MNQDHLCLGLDVGSVSLKTVVLDGAGAVVFEDYRRTNGRPFEAALAVLDVLDKRWPDGALRSLAVTGTGGAALVEVLGGRFVNEIVAESAGLGQVAPEARSAVAMGGQDSKFLAFDGADAARVLRDFATNSLCAAGTGSFLDQQASRLGVAIEEEFAALALTATSPPRIAGRCSVFAKSDMIHLQQISTPVAEIAAGLCLALARSFRSNVARAMTVTRPVAFIGGVASNTGMVRAFETVLGLAPGELVIPPHHATVGAIGAALLTMREGAPAPWRGVAALRAHLASRPPHAGKRLPRLRPFLTPAGTPDGAPVAIAAPAGERVRAYLGVDVGSISTNVVVLDEQDRLLAKRYLATASRPIEAVQSGLAQIEAEIGDRVEICGVATTGSGRYLTGEIVGADVVRNEITAQATAAIHQDPAVDTIFEIGGQDSKYISLEGGAVRDFEMNRACAAGTGSFLEEQAQRLGVDLKTEFSPWALDAESPVGLGDRCTVFMESDLMDHQQRGAETPDLLAGLAYSIVHNYLNRVVGDRLVGERIFFQGGTAFNKAVVAAFNQVTGREVTVPPHHEVTGAIGAAILARRHAEECERRAAAGAGPAYATRFRGFAMSREKFEVGSFVCKSCENLCEIRTVKPARGKPVYYGSRCEKYDVDRHAEADASLPDLFAEREALLLGLVGGGMCGTAEQRCSLRALAPGYESSPACGTVAPGCESSPACGTAAPGCEPQTKTQGFATGGGSQPGAAVPHATPARGTVGIPLALSFYEILPFWRAFFQTLGFAVVTSGATNRPLVRRGLESVAFEICFPVKVAHGHLLELIDKMRAADCGAGVSPALAACGAGVPPASSQQARGPHHKAGSPDRQQAGGPHHKPNVVFVPSFVDAPSEGLTNGDQARRLFNCPFVQTLPYTLRSSLDFAKLGVRVWSPILQMQRGLAALEPVLADAEGPLASIPRREIRQALAAGQAAQNAFFAALEKRGAEVLASLTPERPGLVVVARPYNGCDSGMNLDLPRKLRALGVVAIPIDMLPLSRTPLPARWRHVYWRYAQRILRAATVIRRDKNLHGVYVTNFSCGPDSFVLDYFRREMAGKPYLQLEIDEHSADAGLVTRCEAFLDTLRGRGAKDDGPANAERKGASSAVATRVVYLPRMSPHAFPLAAALRHVGVNAQVMEPSDDESLALGLRHTSGRECYPCLLTTGDMVRQLRRSDFDADRSAFFMASADGPCRFGQYHQLHRHVLDRLGFEQVPILALDQDHDFHAVVGEIGRGLEHAAFRGVLAVDLLEKLLFETRPYERETGATDAWFDAGVARVSEAVEAGRGALWRVLPELARGHAALARRPEPRRPRIGVVGEVYVRTNAYANHDLPRAIESLGGEVIMPGMAEWLYYVNLMRSAHSRTQKFYRLWLRDVLARQVMRHDERRVARAFGQRPEADPRELFRLARPYLDPSFQGEAILTIGKAVEMVRHHGAGGIVNTMPFTCMPGTICAALFRRVREDLDGVPVFHATFAGQRELNHQARLEAFVHQARQYGERNSGARGEKVAKTLAAK